MEAGKAREDLCLRCLAGALLALAVAGVVLTLRPSLDLAVSHFFYRPSWGFLLESVPRYDGVRTVYELVRPTLAWVVAVLLVAMLAAGALAAWRRSAVGGLGARGWAFLLIAFIVGPGLLVNAILKESWGRARPADVAAFGGQHAFTPALVPSAECLHNCSFVAGDPSVGFYLHAVGYVHRRRQRAWLAGGLVAGGLLGLLRIAMGAHFLSDVVFSGVVVMLSTAAVYAALFAPVRWRTARRRAAVPGEAAAP